MFSGALTIAAMVRWPSVVGPTSMILTRSDLLAVSSKYFSIASAGASWPSLPIRKPKCDSGEGACAPAGKAARKVKREKPRIVRRNRLARMLAPAGGSRHDNRPDRLALSLAKGLSCERARALFYGESKDLS